MKRVPAVVAAAAAGSAGGAGAGTIAHAKGGVRQACEVY